MKIEELIASGPSPRCRVRAAVMRNYRQIEVARSLGWTWAEIAESIGLPPDRWRGVIRAFKKLPGDFPGGRVPPGLQGGQYSEPAARQVNPETRAKHIKIDL